MDQTAISQSKENRRKAAHMLSLARQAKVQLNIALDKLGSARGWGIFDIMGGGFLSTLIKHSKIDDAQNAIHRAQPYLNEINTQIKTLRLHSDMRLETGGFAMFADYFFDGMLADLFVQSKIRDLRENVEHVIDKLNELERALRQLDEYEAENIKKAGG